MIMLALYHFYPMDDDNYNDFEGELVFDPLKCKKTPFLLDGCSINDEVNPSFNWFLV